MIIMLCQVCEETLNKESTVDLPCQHNLCKNCTESVIKVAIKGYDIASIRCPNPKCLRPFRESFILSFLDTIGAPSFQQNYIKILQDHALLKDEDMILCPNNACQFIISYRKGNYRQWIECQNCCLVFCSECRLTSHTKDLCEVDRSDNLRGLRKKKVVKMCPTCKVPIEKTDGCNHVACLFCGKPFCWICGRAYTRWHYSVYNFFFGCPGMEKTKKSSYFGANLRNKLVIFFIILLLVLTYTFFALFINLVYLIFTIVPGLATAAVIHCVLKRKLTKTQFFLIQLAVYQNHQLFSYFLAGMLLIGVFFLLFCGLYYLIISAKQKGPLKSIQIYL